MEAQVYLHDHPVYQSLFRTLEYAGLDPKKTENYRASVREFYLKDSFFVQNLDLPLKKRNVCVLPSPTVAIETWRALFGGLKAIVDEEYFAKSSAKDFLCRSLLFPFKKYPFISHTKRTHEFLKRRSFNSFLIPPAEKKRNGSKNRDLILFVGKMIASKDPFLFVELAKWMRDDNFVMIGRGPLLPEVKEKAKGVGNLEIVERVDSRETLFRDYYAKAKALVHPAFKDPIAFVIIEALSTSTPVIASSSVGASDYLPENWRMDGYDLDKWACKLSSIGQEDSKKAEEIFEWENLNIEGEYFGKVGSELKKFMEDKGWL